MLRRFAVYWVLCWCWCWAAEEPAAQAPVYQHLVLVETSAAMVRQKEVAIDTVHGLILNGFNGRIRNGEILGIWPYREQVDRKFVRPIRWSAREARDLSNFIYRKFRDLEFSKKSMLSQALSAVQAEAALSDRLTLYLVSSGSELIRGTAFDAEVNGVFEQHADAMGKAGRPFVTVLIFEGGGVVAQAVTPGGRDIYIPARPTAADPAAATPAAVETESEVLEPVAEPATPVRPMTVDEISAKLREAQAQQVVVESALRESDATRVEAVEPRASQGEAMAEDATDASVLADKVAEEATSEMQDLVAAPVSDVRQEAVLPPDEPMPRSEREPAGVPGAEIVLEPEPQPAPVGRDSESTGPEMVDSREALVAASDTMDAGVSGVSGTSEETISPGMMLVPGRKGVGARVYLGAGVLLLVLAGGALWWRARSPGRQKGASLISQGMHQK